MIKIISLKDITSEILMSYFISQGPPEKQNPQDIEREIFKALPYKIIRPGKSKFVGQASRVVIQVRVNIIVLSPNLSLKPTGQVRKLEKLRQSFYQAVQRKNCFFFGKPKFLLSKPSTDKVRLTHIMESNLLYSVY